MLEAELKRLEAEYNMYFSGRLPKPPSETRGRVESIVKQLDRTYIKNYGDRFRFATLQSRFATLSDLWDRGLRAREEGRPGPFAHKRPAAPAAPAAPKKPEDRILRVAAFRDPEVHKAITSGPHGRIAVTYMEWAGPPTQQVVLPWTRIDGPEAARAFADRRRLHARTPTLS